MPGERRPPLTGVAYEEAIAAQAAANGFTTDGFTSSGFGANGSGTHRTRVNGAGVNGAGVNGHSPGEPEANGFTATFAEDGTGDGESGGYGNGTGAHGAGGPRPGGPWPGGPRPTAHSGRSGPVIVTPFDPLRLCVYATVALLGWVLGPFAVIAFAGVGFAGYVRARRAGLVRSKCLLRDTRLVLAYLGLIVVAAIAAIVLKFFT
ncbi:hypothetical protein [Microtetraspora fusca]|uniref:hypothetical protein n=1 Tax=Microtetraspora fusca TaxID=1997 RepID=UPI000AF00FD9|nr:hypothetical protein [Microtetraspora fusca]